MSSCAKYPTYNMVWSFYFLPFQLKYPFSVSGEESSDLHAHNIVFLIMVYRNVIFPLCSIIYTIALCFNHQSHLQVCVVFALALPLMFTLMNTHANF